MGDSFDLMRFSSKDQKLMARSVTGPYRRIVFNGFVGSDPRADQNVSFKTPSRLPLREGGYLVVYNAPTIILINPWIYDFAAYDLWSKPLGLLYIAAYLKETGFNVCIIDCLDVYHPEMECCKSMFPPVRRKYGIGKYWRQRIPAPPVLSHVKRAYSRYGITTDLYKKELQRIKNPSAILVTSLMTYWYPGVREAIKLAKEVHPGVPVILGGIYARLCTEHARQFSGADYISPETYIHDMGSIIKLFQELDIKASEMPIKRQILYPAFDQLSRFEYACILTSTGCPYRCQYCASSYLYPSFSQRDPLEVIEEIKHWNREGDIIDFAFYDDALLVNSERHAIPMMEGIIRSGLNIRFHTPNALHVREISGEMAGLLYGSGFCTLRLGLETSDMDRHDNLDRKVSEGDFEKAVKNLAKAGFRKRDIGAYILMGLPGQSVESVEDTIGFVDGAGAVPYLAEYSPIPHTPLWDKSIEYSSYDIANEPLYHNNSLLPCWEEDKRQKVSVLRQMVKEIRKGS